MVRLKHMYQDYSYLPLSGRRTRILRVLLNDGKSFLKNLKVLLARKTTLHVEKKQLKEIVQLISDGLQQFKQNWEKLSSFDLYYRFVSEDACLTKVPGK